MSRHALALSTTEIVQTTFPGRAALTPAEVALLLLAIGDESGVKRVRDLLNQATPLSGVKKSGGRWLIPIASLVSCIEAMDRPALGTIEEGKSSHSSVSIPIPSGSSHARRRAALSNRPGILATQAREAWSKVWEKYDVLSALKERMVLDQHLDQTVMSSTTNKTLRMKPERF